MPDMSDIYEIKPLRGAKEQKRRQQLQDLK